MAMNLARLVADVMPDGRSGDADMMFAASANADFDHATMRYCARKFGQVRTFRCLRDINGWPAGPNNQAHEVATHFAQMCRTGRWDYSGILMGEPDCVPLRRDFLTLLRQEWDQGPKTVLGPWVTNGPAPYNQHINGNSIFGPDFIYNHRQIFKAEDGIGWDAQNAGLLLKHGRASMWMYSDYQLGQPQNPWKGCDHLFSRRPLREPHPFWKLVDQEVAYCHGIKAWEEAQECVRQRLLGEELKVLPAMKVTPPPPPHGRNKPLVKDKPPEERKPLGIPGST